MLIDLRFGSSSRSHRAVRVGVCLAMSLFALAGSGVLQAAPPELLDPTTGQSVKLAPGADALHVVFFATWCPSCREEFPRLARLEERWLDRGYRLVVVAVQNRHDGERLARFVADEQPPGTLLFDAQRQAQSRWSARELPTHIVFAADGTEVFRSDRLDGQVEQAIRDLLQPPSGGSGGAP